MKKAVSFVMVLAAVITSTVTYSLAQPATQQPTLHQVLPQQANPKPPGYVDPMQVLAQVMLPNKPEYEYSVGAWGVDTPSPVKWNTPGIIMSDNDKDFYAFSRKGKIPNWNVAYFGPRAGVFRVQMNTNQPYNAKLGLYENRISHQLVGCTQEGPMLLIAPAGKAPGYLYLRGMQEMHLWPSAKQATKEDMATAGITKLIPAPYCKF